MKFLKSVIIYIFLCISLLSNVYAEDYLDASFYLLRLINEARSNPIKALNSLGIDQNNAIRALGSNAWVLDLEDGLPPLAWSSQLFDSASSHNHDMVEQVYYDYTSQDGLSPADRISSQGYEALIAQETLGLISFDIYIEPIEAAKFIFMNILSDELNPDYNFKKNIFNPDLTEVGISFIATTFEVGADEIGEKIVINVYVIVIDFATPVEERSYIIGNVYLDLEKNIFEDSLDFISDLNIFLKVDEDAFEREMSASIGPMGTFQIPAPTGFFFLEARDVQDNILGIRNGFGLNINQLIDFKISVDD